MTLSDRELMELDVETGFTFDAAGRMVMVNEPGGGPAPRFFLGRTPEGNIWRFRHDLPPDLVEELTALAASEPVVQDLEPPPVGFAAMTAAIERHAPIRNQYRGPAFRFPETAPHRPPAEAVQAAGEQMRPFLPDFLPLLVERRPSYVVLVDGAAVSVCECARKGSRAAAASLETAAGFRGRGYAAAVVSAWAAAIQREGLIPLYGTEWTNTASRRVAAKLGLVLYGENCDWA